MQDRDTPLGESSWEKHGRLGGHIMTLGKKLPAFSLSVLTGESGPFMPTSQGCKGN